MDIFDELDKPDIFDEVTADLSKVKPTAYEAAKLQPGYSAMGTMGPLNPEEVLSLAQLPSDLISLPGKAMVALADIPTRIANIGKDETSPGYVPTLASGRGTIQIPEIPLTKEDEKELRDTKNPLQFWSPEATGAYNLLARTVNQIVPPFAPPETGLIAPVLGGGGQLGKAAGLAFGGSMAVTLPEQIRQAMEVANEPTAGQAEKISAIGQPVVNAALAGLMLKHGATGEPVPQIQGPPATGKMLRLPETEQPPAPGTIWVQPNNRIIQPEVVTGERVEPTGGKLPEGERFPRSGVLETAEERVVQQHGHPLVEASPEVKKVVEQPASPPTAPKPIESSKLQDEAVKADKRLKAREQQLTFGSGPFHALEDLKDLAIITAAKTQSTVRTLKASKVPRKMMAYTKDAANNAANILAKRVSNDIRGSLRRTMGRTRNSQLDEQALSFVVETDGVKNELASMRGKLLASTSANPKVRDQALAAIDHAEKNWDKMVTVAQQYKAVTDYQSGLEQAAGMSTITHRAYVPHVQELQDPFGFLPTAGGGSGSSSFKHIRTHETFADSIAAGIDPKSLNAVDLLHRRLANGHRILNNRAWAESLRTVIDPQTSKPIAADVETVARGPGLPPDVRAPRDYVTEDSGGARIAILKPYAGLFDALSKPSKFDSSLGAQFLLRGTQTGKSIALMVDTFHLGRLALWESLIKTLSFTDPKLPLPSYKKGSLALDYSVAELNHMANAGEIDPASLPNIMRVKSDSNQLVRRGYNIGQINDALMQEWIHAVPLAGKFNKWLFSQFQRGAMAEVGSLEVGRYRRMHPSWTDDQVYREVAKDLNTRFGNLGRQGVFKGKTFQDFARLIALAPQWNEGLIRSELGAVSGLVKGIQSTAKERKLSFGVLPRAVGTMMVAQFAANQLINYITRGYPTWENPEEGYGAKLSAWIPDLVGKGPGFFLHPAGLAAEVTHLLTSKYEKTSDFRQALLSYMGGRYSTTARPIMTFITGKNPFGKAIRPQDIYKETLKSAIPLPIGGSAVASAVQQLATGEKKEAFPGQYQKQIMASAGIKTDQAPSPVQRIQGLAQEFNRKRGIEPSAEFYQGDFHDLADALNRGAMKEAAEHLADLQKKKTMEVIVRHFENAPMLPFTRSQRTEGSFVNGLSEEQRRTYDQALKDRMKITQNFFQLLKGK